MFCAWKHKSFKYIHHELQKGVCVREGKGKRVGIVGAGNVSATVAYSLAMLGSCHEIILRYIITLFFFKSIDL